MIFPHLLRSQISPFPSLLIADRACAPAHLWNVQFALSHRRDADTLLLTPSVAYASCSGVAEWRRACGEYESVDAAKVDQCHESGNIPCETAMALITAYGRARQWKKLPLVPRNWDREGGRPGRTMGDFCLRREFGLMEASPKRVQLCVESKGSDNECMSC